MINKLSIRSSFSAVSAIAIGSLIGMQSVSASASDTLLKNATILTVTKGTIKKGDLLIHNGKIAAIGKNIKAPAGAQVFDLTGKYVMPGILDAHSHMAIEGGVNEASEVVSAEVNIYDVINEKDPGMKWALAAGVTTINTMHGSANPIGGLVATLKLRWGKPSEDLKFAGARQHIKFALGENPKRVHVDRGITTRLGVAESLRKEFTDAKDYMAAWDDYNKKKSAGQPAVPPRRDIRLDSMVGVLKGDIWVQSHCYRSDEIEMLLKLSDEFGFHIGALQHVLEGYKVAPEIAKRGIGASTFSDFWGYKLEAYDGNIYNPAAMAQWGVRTSINSDDAGRIRRLNLDAAKSLRYGGLTDDECLALITINPAWQLGIDKQIGSLEIGKDADICVWDDHPLSPYAKCVKTMIDGDVYFDLKSDGTATYGLPSTTPVAAKPADAAVAAKPAVVAAKPGPSTFEPIRVPVTMPVGGTASFAITNARIVTVSGPVIENGTVVVENGRITAVGSDVNIPSGVRSVSGRGLSVYPGFINATGNLGLSEISSITESMDLGERGSMNAFLRAGDAYHTQSAWVGLSLCAGITSSLVSPKGSGWMGRPAIMHTAGRTVDDATVVFDAGQALSLGGITFGAFGGDGLVGGPDAAGAGADDSIAKAIADARNYSKKYVDAKVRPEKTDLLLEALIPVVKGEKPVYIGASNQTDIEDAVKFGSSNHLNVVIKGGKDADKVAAELNKSGVPVIFTDSWNMAVGSDNFDKQFAAPKRLYDAGVKFCIAHDEGVNLPQIAANAAAFGLPKDEALKAITLYPAQILGVDKDLGSIEIGKIADLLLTDGDPLDYHTHIKKIFVNGIDTPIVSRHSKLYDEYKKKGK